MRSTAPENVAQHSFQVALLSHMLCSIGNVHFARSLNADRAAAMALFHDATEVFTGDIATPVKHNNPRLLSSFRDMERIAAERLIGMIPPELSSVYAPLLQPQDSPSGSEDARLLRYVKAADHLDAYLKLRLGGRRRQPRICRRQSADRREAARAWDAGNGIFPGPYGPRLRAVPGRAVSRNRRRAGPGGRRHPVMSSGPAAR